MIRSDGTLGGYNQGSDKKRALLEQEQANIITKGQP
ncbi:MAG TPA: MGMT family protein [Candidatus Babeliales bacterium]|nr:MGMT family protein [Candidatus Babeliales bacterium]